MSFETDWLALADDLRQLRERAGLTGIEFAKRLGAGWSNSKLSKIEVRRQMPTDNDLCDIGTALGLPQEQTDELRERLRELRAERIAWRGQLRRGHRERQEQDQRDEADAASILAVDVATVPGILQTADWARWIFRSQAELLHTPTDDIEDAVRARMERQRVIYDSAKTVEVLMTETALRYTVCPLEVLAGQIAMLTTVTSLSTVRFGIVPAGRVPFVPWHGFWIVDGVVYVELLGEEIRIHDPDQVEVYRRFADGLWSVAVEGEQARTALRRIADELSAV